MNEPPSLSRPAIPANILAWNLPTYSNRPAPDIEQVTLTPAADTAHFPRDLAHPEMRLRVLEILVRPEIPLVILGITFTGDNRTPPPGSGDNLPGPIRSDSGWAQWCSSSRRESSSGRSRREAGLLSTGAAA